jgi:hypothetical protein
VFVQAKLDLPWTHDGYPRHYDAISGVWACIIRSFELRFLLLFVGWKRMRERKRRGTYPNGSKSLSCFRCDAFRFPFCSVHKLDCIVSVLCLRRKLSNLLHHFFLHTHRNCKRFLQLIYTSHHLINYPQHFDQHDHNTDHFANRRAHLLSIFSLIWFSRGTSISTMF